MRALSFILLLALAAPLAAAQLPIPVPTGCGPISYPAAPTPPAEALAAGARTPILVEVQNEGQLPATITVTANIREAGWTVTSTPAPTSIAAGQSQTFSFEIEAGAEATADAQVTFAASGSCDTPLGANCPGGACAIGTINTQIVIPFQPDEGFRIPGLENLDIQPEYLIAAIVLVGIASAIPFAMRRKKAALRADCPEPLKMVKPGRGTSFPIEIKNAGKEPASATFEVGPVPEGWSAFMPLPEVQLAAQENRSLWLMVRSPATAANGEAVDIELRLHDTKRRGGENGAVVRVRAEVQGGDAA